MLAWWPSQPVSVSKALRSNGDPLNSPPVDIFDAIGRIFQDIETWTAFLLFVFSYKLKYIASSQWSLHSSHALFVTHWRNEWGSSRPCDFLATTPQASLPSMALASFSKCSYPPPSPPVLPLHQSLCRWGETTCSGHSPPHTSCLFSLCCNPQGWKGRDSFCWNFVLKWDLSHANCRQ